MASLSVIINPLTEQPAKTRRVLVFSANSTSLTPRPTLALEQQELKEDPGWKLMGVRSNKAPSPPLKKGSALVSLLHHDMVHTYGVLDSRNIVSLVSPVYHPVVPEITAASNWLAGCTARSEVWLFYQGYDNTNRTVTIEKKEICDTVTGGINCKAPEVLPDTRLAATYDGDKKWVIYMDTHERLVAWNETDAFNVTPRSRDVKLLTTIAANFVPAADMPSPFNPALSKGRLFVYYLNNETEGDILYRNYVDLPINTVPIKFSVQEIACTAPQAIRNDVQMSVVADPAEKCNWIYAIKKDNGDETISAMKDKWIK